MNRLLTMGLDKIQDECRLVYGFGNEFVMILKNKLISYKQGQKSMLILIHRKLLISQ